MVPSVPGCVMWWRGQAAIRPTGLPVWLAFQIGAVTGSAVFPIDLLTKSNLLRISRVGLPPLRLATNAAQKSCGGHRGNSSGNPDDDENI